MSTPWTQLVHALSASAGCLTLHGLYPTLILALIVNLTVALLLIDDARPLW